MLGAQLYNSVLNIAGQTMGQCVIVFLSLYDNVLLFKATLHSGDRRMC